MNKVLGGLSIFQSLAEAIRQQQPHFDLKSLSPINHIARSFAKRLKPIVSMKAMMGSIPVTQFPQIKSPIKSYALTGLTNQLALIKKNNVLISDQLSSLASSQLAVSSSLAEAIKSIQPFNKGAIYGLNSYIQLVSGSYLKEIARDKEWNELEIARDINLALAQKTNELTEDQGQATNVDLENLRNSIVDELSNLFKKSKKPKTQAFIIKLITIISFLITLYTYHQGMTGMSNEVVIEETKRIVKESNDELYQKIEQEFNKLHNSRIALTNVNLRKDPKKRSKILAVVPKDQIVTVVEIQHKYLLIVYLDKNTGEPKTGFVVKKYFDKLK